METERLLADLNQEQLKAVTHQEGPIITIAGAGSGKTRVLTKRIARRILQGETEPDRVLALTFTNKAAIELNQRINQLGLRDKVLAGTFHAIALNQVKEYYQLTNKTMPKLITNPKLILDQVIDKQLKKHLPEILTEIQWAKVRTLDNEGYLEQAKNSSRYTEVSHEQIADFFVKYENKKAQLNKMDFDDILYFAINALTKNEKFSSAIRWRHRHFYIDEFQDINLLQYSLLRKWLGDRTDLFLVGDPKQAIYEWNGADVNLLNELESESDITKITLSKNYRSSPEILDAANNLLGQNHALEATQPSGETPQIFALKDEEKEAEFIISQILKWNQLGYPLHKQAVMARTKKRLNTLIEKLKKAGINYTLAITDRASDQLNSQLDKSSKLEKDNSLTLTTFHSSKGLEWPIVYLAGIENGLIPISHAKTNAQKEEEKRLFYVALTRAEKKLFITWTETKDNKYKNQPSQFLHQIKLPTTKQITQVERTMAKSKIQQIKETLNLTRTDKALLSNLEQWRNKKARSANIDQKVILSDEILEKITKLKPKSLEDLESHNYLRKTQVNNFGQEIIDLVNSSD